MTECKSTEVRNRKKIQIREELRFCSRIAVEKADGNHGSRTAKWFQLMKEDKSTVVMNTFQMRLHQESESDSPLQKSIVKGSCSPRNTAPVQLQAMPECTSIEAMHNQQMHLAQTAKLENRVQISDSRDTRNS
jgi:hypothetical protein